MHAKDARPPMTDPTAAAAWECVVTSRDGDVIQCDAYAMDGSKDIEFWTIEVPGNQWQEGHAFYVLRALSQEPQHG